AMLEPRMVAARIHGSAARLHGLVLARDLIAPSSQGCMKMFAIPGSAGILPAPSVTRAIVKRPGRQGCLRPRRYPSYTNVPLRKSLSACWISSLVFITNGPYLAIVSFRGLPDT